MVLENTLESPLDYKEILPVHSEGDQPWVFIGRTDAKAETPITGYFLMSQLLPSGGQSIGVSASASVLP